MKNIISLLLAFCVTVATFAQVPQSFGFQTVVRNNNRVITNSTVGARFTILKRGTSVYCEQQTVTTNANGVAYFEIGKGTVVSGVFADIEWLSARFFLKTEIDPNGGTNYSTTETVEIELKSVPYAMLSGKANTFTKIDSLMALYNNRLSATDSLLGININRLRAIDSLILIRLYSDSVFYDGIGRFATSDTTFITFSPANIWFRPSDTSWMMPSHQWDTAGQVSNSQLAVGYAGWIDMLSWGSSGCGGVFPTDTSFTGNHYGNGLSSLNGTCYDWPFINNIKHRSTTYPPDTWRTPTDAEWRYILSQRPGAANKRCLASVNGINGLVILPDDWPGMPFGCTFRPQSANWTDNVYNGIFWTAMETRGAVFLPAAGYLHRSVPYHCHDQGMQGFYWSETTSATSDADAYYMNFGLMYGFSGARLVVAPSNVCSRDYFHSVRLVKDIQNED